MSGRSSFNAVSASKMGSSGSGVDSVSEFMRRPIEVRVQARAAHPGTSWDYRKTDGYSLGNCTLLDQFTQSLIHCLHSFFAARGNHGWDLKCLLFADEASNTRVATRISYAAMRLLPSAFGSSCWEMTARSDSDSIVRTCDWRSVGTRR